jgi:3-oxoacyl-[acyl-carrier protein] reductase
MNSNAKPLAGKSAIVTGAATGIGKAIAARLARDGAAVVVNHLRSHRKEAEAVVAALRNGRGTALAVAADISKREQFAELFDRAGQAFGRVDVLVNNAAVAPLTPIAEASDEQIGAVLAVNVKGTLYGCQLAAERLADGGRIINLSSSTTGSPSPATGSTTCPRAQSSS